MTDVLVRPWELLLILSSQKYFHLVSCENYGSPLMSFHYLHFSKAEVAGFTATNLKGVAVSNAAGYHVGASACKGHVLAGSTNSSAI